MKYETTRDLAMKLYPMLYPNEYNFLNHAFFVLGTGYEWFNGELCKLVIDPETGKFRELTAFEITARVDNNKFNKALNDLLNETNSKTSDERLDFFATAPSIYPLCRLSNICNLPDNIKPDWLDAASKVVDYVFDVPYKMTKEDKVWLKKAKTRIADLKQKQNETIE